MTVELLQTLAILDQTQWKKLQNVILTQHSKTSDTYKIFNFLKLNQKQFPNDHVSEPLRLKKFPHIKHKRFLNLLSTINLITEDYLIMDHYEKNNIQKDILLNKIYNDRGLFNKADKKARKVRKRVDHLQELSLEKYQFMSKLRHQQYYSDNPIKYKKGEILLEQLVENELVKTKIQLLVYKCELINWGNIKSYDYSSQIECIGQVSELITDTDISIILDKLEQLLLKPNLSDFTALKSTLYNKEFSCPSDLHTIITMYLLNSSIKLWHMDIYKDADENAKLFEYALDTGVLLYNGKIPAIRFQNLISTIGTLKPFDWTQGFIERWKDKVAGKDNSSTIKLAKAQNAFEHDRYDLIIPLIRGVEFEYGSQKITALGLELIVLYIDRKQNYTLLKNFINNFKRNLKRQKSSVSYHYFKSHLNLIKVIELLIKKDFSRVTIHLNKYDSLIYRKWLQRQI